MREERRRAERLPVPGRVEAELVYRTGLEFIEPDSRAVTRLLAAART